ncbi:hypothetical protein ACQPYE_03220 [Actinosynnema sp. CA-299493]
MRPLAPGVHQLLGRPPHVVNAYPVEDVLVDAGTPSARKRLDQGPVQLVYGRYAPGPRAGSLESTGGHIVTAVSAKGSFDGGTVQLKPADPGRALDHGQDDYLHHQSAYESLDVTLERKTVVEHIAAKDDANTPADESLLPAPTATWCGGS